VGTNTSPKNSFPARDANAEAQYGTHANAQMQGLAVNPTGGGQAHENRMPYISINYIIALQGIFPSQN
jgi:microcystin-dependent protein